jgi:hypothetical protein
MSVLFFWVVMPCKLVGRHQSFGKTGCPIFRAENGDFLQSAGIYLEVHKASQPRRTASTSSPP